MNTDKMAYDLLQKDNPEIITTIQEILDKGGKAWMVERFMIRKFGRGSLVATLALGAAYWLESERSKL